MHKSCTIFDLLSVEKYDILALVLFLHRKEDNFMKVKTFISTAVMLALLANMTAPVSSAAVCSANAVTEGRKIAAENGIVLSTDEAAASLSVLSNFCNGALPEMEFDEAGTLRDISGSISGKTVSGQRDAEAIVRRLAGLLGVSDFDSELAFDGVQNSLYNDIYRFRQVFRGVPVDGGGVTLIVDNASGQVRALGNTFVKDLSLDTVPAFPAAKAKAILGTADEPDLLIFGTEDGAYKLAWFVVGSTAEAGCAFVDAQTGAILSSSGVNNYSYSTYIIRTDEANPVTGTKDLSVQLDNVVQKPSVSSGIYMHDSKRNIWILNGLTDTRPAGLLEEAHQNGITSMSSIINDPLNDPYMQISIRQLYVNPSDLPTELENPQNAIYVGGLYQISRVYDYYKQAFLWSGVDNNNGSVFFNPCARGGGSYAAQPLNYIQMRYSSDENNDVMSREIVAHEYTHLVTGYKIGWSFSGDYGQTPSLNEGYSDVMGEYIGTKRDWKKDGTCRDATKNTSASYYTGSDDKKYYYKFTNASQMNSVEGHCGATIVLRTAYLMEKYGVPYQIARDTWYTSMDYLGNNAFGTNNATFEIYRGALTSAVQQVTDRYASMYSAENRLKYQSYVIMALNAVNLKNPGYYRKMGDLNCDGKVNSSDVNKLQRYLNGNYTLSYAYKLAQADVNYDGKITSADLTKLRNAVNNGTTGSL